MIGIAYIACGIVYMMASIMDGQDIKPLWKKWLGKRLEKAANRFFPIEYVIDTKYIHVPSPSPFERCSYDHMTFDAQKIESNYLITEQELFELYMRMPFGNKDVVERIITERKKACIRAIFDKVSDYVSYEVDRESHRPSIIVRAWLYVGKKRK